MKPKNYLIKEKRSEAPSVNSLILNKQLDSKLGQFYMVWAKGIDEIPISPSSVNPGRLTIRNVGEASEKLCQYKAGEKVGLRGPFGSSFEERGEKILLVAGGIGSAPILPLAKKMRDKEITIALGGITKEELLFVSKFRELGNTIVATEDGSKGYQGYVTEAISDLDISAFDSVYSCGPEPMMYKVFKRVRDKEIFAQFSLHRYIKCGVGLCGSCCIDPEGLRACDEGPIFNKNELKNSEFGSYKRDSCGRKTDLI
ncbi:dihydroorotate dehydrogenase electron transfer subunit [archaeon SCG-AAA382B04]|nr:dihydroorotate dehydrogenase electron transfer subunit [archaeon SCG-AAA382B04]